MKGRRVSGFWESFNPLNQYDRILGLFIDTGAEPICNFTVDCVGQS